MTTKMLTLPLTDALCKPDQTTAYVRSHSVHWQNPSLGEYYLEYSYNQRNWYSLNGGNTITLPTEGLLLLPEIVTMDPGGAEIPLHDLRKLTQTFGAPEPVYLSKIEDINARILEKDNSIPQNIWVEYTNGMIEKRNIVRKGADAVIQEPKYPSPLVMHRADPYIYKHTDGSYYFMGSYTDAEHNLDGKYQYLYLILRRSDTLAGLSDENGQYEECTVWEEQPINNGTASPHLWAPELHYIHGKWYIYYTASISPESSWRIRPHCLECVGDDPIHDSWICRGPIQTTIENDIAFTDFSLDHTYFHHDGKDYFVWAQKTNNISDLYIAQLENPWTLCSPSVLLSRPEYNWEQHGFAVEEGPSIIKHDNRIFLTFSSSGTDATYCMGLLSADFDSDLLDATSWTKCPHPVFQSSKSNSCYGPGHNSFVRSEDNNEDLFVYHARDDARYLGEDGYQPLYDAGRNAYIGKVFWNLDGTPNFSVPGSSIASDPEHLIIHLND